MIIKHYRKPLLFYQNEAWKRKARDTTFNCTMESTMVRNSASLLEYTLKNILSRGNIGLYRDNGLFILRKINKQINYEKK